MPEGKKDPELLKKTEIALNLIDRTLKRKYHPGIVILDSGYGKNTSVFKKLENRKLKDLGGIAKNRKVTLKKEYILTSILRDELAKSLPRSVFTEVEIILDKPKKV
ncbi:MAG: transposase [Moorea sp. SIO2B7]|nr:transposase [Moorena sp. SIO2B7]